MNIVTNYVAQTAERAVRSGSATALLAVGGMTTNIIGWNWLDIGGAFAAGFIIETLLCLGAQPVGDPLSPSILPAQGTIPAKLP